MANISFIGRYSQQIGFVLLSVAASASLYGQSSNETGPPPASEASAKVILEVVNNHFTVGRKIPSVYLRVFSDGTAECHAKNPSRRDEDATIKKHLSPQEFAEINAVLNGSGLRDVKGRYELGRIAFDSWMEWDIRIDSPQSARSVTVSFAGVPSRYPDALRRLGCLILAARREVYGDDTNYYRPACVDASPQK